MPPNDLATLSEAIYRSDKGESETSNDRTRASRLVCFSDFGYQALETVGERSLIDAQSPNCFQRISTPASSFQKIDTFSLASI
jgi:hypothetical protein